MRRKLKKILAKASILREINIGEGFTPYQMSLMRHELLRESEIFNKDITDEIVRAGDPCFFIDYGNLPVKRAEAYVKDRVNYYKYGKDYKKRETE